MPDILICGMEMPKRCEDCMCYRREISHAYCTISSVNVLGHGNARLDNCPLIELPEQTVETNLYDQEEIHHDCTVQILKNSVTGEVSVGWWENDNKPNETKEGN